MPFQMLLMIDFLVVAVGDAPEFFKFFIHFWLDGYTPPLTTHHSQSYGTVPVRDQNLFRD